MSELIDPLAKPPTNKYINPVQASGRATPSGSLSVRGGNVGLVRANGRSVSDAEVSIKGGMPQDMAGLSNGQSYVTAYWQRPAEWFCTILAYGQPVHEGSDTPTAMLAVCTMHRDDLQMRELLVDATPMDSVGVPMNCVICDPQFLPWTPDVP